MFVPTYRTQHDPTTHIKEEAISYEEENFISSPACNPAGRIDEYTATYMKDEPDGCDGHHTDSTSYTPEGRIHRTSTCVKVEPVLCDPSGHTSLYKEEADSCEGGHLASSQGHIQQYSHTHFKEEPGDTIVTTPNMCSLTDCAHYQSPHFKEESHEEGHLSGTPTAHTSQYTYMKQEAASQDHTHHPSAAVKEEPDTIIYTLTDSIINRYLSPHVKEEPAVCHTNLKPTEIRVSIERTQHFSPAPIKGEPISYMRGLLNNTNYTDHTQETSSRCDQEETESYDEADISDTCTAKEQNVVSVDVQHLNRAQNHIDYAQSGSVSAYHHTTQSSQVTFTCPECEASFNSKPDLEEHVSLHRGKKTHVCSHCGKRFSYQSQLLIHERTHTGEKPFTCSECGKCFNQYVHLAIHLMSHTGEKPYVCTECGKSFNRKTTLTIHQRIHTGEKPFHCTQCGKYFSTSSNLIKHQRVHTGEKPYSCSECHQLFVHYTQLIRHQAHHSSEKPFSCSVCGKLFSQKAQCLRHERFHKADNTYSCPECDQSYKHYKDLLAHQSSHTGQNLFRCEECGKEFESNLRFHSGVKTFSCPQCGKSFGLSSNLTKRKRVYGKEKSRWGDTA